MGAGRGRPVSVAQVPQEVETRVVGMTEKSGKLARRLASRIEPFASEQERLEALDNFRKWIGKLEQWQEGMCLKIRVTKRDLN